MMLLSFLEYYNSVLQVKNLSPKDLAEYLTHEIINKLTKKINTRKTHKKKIDDFGFVYWLDRIFLNYLYDRTD